MAGHARKRLVERGTRLLEAAASMVNRADRVPRVGRRLAQIELAVALELQLARELVERGVVITLRGEDEAVQIVEADGLEAASLRSLRILRGTPRAKLVERGAKGLARDEHGCGKPVGERQPRTEGEDAMRGAQPLLAPADKRQPEVVMPVIRIEHDGFPRGRNRFARLPAAMQHERQRAPCFAR